ncbi:unnamed protein product [Rotaria socialis]|uniref:Uncharacterized protein n=1 Tax=Rotaria socialis TaxID=392032 RepID=A0A819ARR9_9BILA|nr:unnamed protein product [Rotaria socialis]
MEGAQYRQNDTPSGVSSGDNKTKFADSIIKFYCAKLHIVMIVLDLVIGSVELGEGIKNGNQCPIQPMIGTFLIVHGAVSIFSGFTLMLAVRVAHYVCRQSERTIARPIFFLLLIIIIIINLFFFGWFIAGNIWVFGASANGVQGSNPTNSATYCQSDMYHAAIVLIIARYIVVPIIIIIVIAVRCCKKTK